METQFRNDGRAVLGKGQYEIRQEFQHLAVNDQQWSKLTKEGRMRKLETYMKSSMAPAAETTSDVLLLPVTASICGVNTVPMSTLTAMFDKANHLLQMSNNVVPKPSASDDWLIVAGHGNAIHIVKPGKGASLRCDRA